MGAAADGPAGRGQTTIGVAYALAGGGALGAGTDILLLLAGVLPIR